MKICSSRIAVLVGVCAPLCSHATDANIDRRVLAFLQATQIPGVAVAVVRPDGDYAKGFGRRAVNSDLPVDEHTLFKLNSVTKSMTATAMAALVDQGKLRWNDRIIDHYPEFRLSDPWITREVRFEDALSHRVGVEATDWMEDLPDLPLTEAIARMRYLPQQDSFRATLRYDNFMYSVAGVAAGRAGGDWDRMIQENLFKPLGMTDSITNFEPYVRADQIAPCHECELDSPALGLQALAKPINIAAPHLYAQGRAQLSHWRISNSRPAGAIWSSAHDMLAYLKLYIGAGKLDGREVLSEKAMRQLTTARTPSSKAGITGPRKQNRSEFEQRSASAEGGNALGWVVGRYLGHALVTHDGASIEFQSDVVILPEDGIAVAVMANLRDGRADLAHALARDVADELLGLPAVDWTGNRLRELAMEQVSSVDAPTPVVTPTVAAAYIGAYMHPAYGKITIQKRDAQTLILSQGRNRWGTLLPVGHDSFELRWNGVRPGHHPVDFIVNGEGQATELRLRGQTFLRSPTK